VNIFDLRSVLQNPNLPATAVHDWSFELVRQMAAPDFDLELSLHRARN
jgi:hypothetical protein